MALWIKMTKMALLTLLVGVVATRVVNADQSEPAFDDEQPISSLENDVGQRRVATPEVVLQLKYNRGELNKIYLTQFRKGKAAWAPSVPARTNLCADLCHAGLGGSACGATCSEMLPIGLHTVLLHPNGTSAVYGEPRYAVCPTLCANKLGEPLCNCSAFSVEVVPLTPIVDWSGVCATFCATDRYTLGGCPACDENQALITAGSHSSRILNTEAGWTAWCGLQCGQGHGGAACNCERSPLQ